MPPGEGPVEPFGYLGIFIGTFLEGESLLLLGGFLAERGYLELWAVALTGFIGSYTGHLLLYLLGWWKGEALLTRFGRLRSLYPQARTFIQRHGSAAVLFSQYVYGVRTVASVAFGLVGMAPRRYLLLQFVSCASWALLVAGVGYLYGETLGLLLGDLRRYEGRVLALLAVVTLAYAAWRVMRVTRTARRAEDSKEPSA